MDNGKLEAQITIPSGGWSMDIEDDINTQTVTVPAGTYYHSSVGSGTRSFADELEYQGNLVLSDTLTVSISSGEGGTGKYTISLDGGTNEITWTNTDLRDLMGFDNGQGTGATSYTSDNAAQGIWLPEYPCQRLHGGSWRGYWETDQQNAETSSGHVFSVMGRKKRVLDLTWPAESAIKTWSNSGGNRSFERFLLYGIYGTDVAWGTSGGPIRYHPDADINTSNGYGTYYVMGMENWRPTQVRRGWTGLWRIHLPRLVQVPS